VDAPATAEDRAIAAAPTAAAKLALELHACGDGGELLSAMVNPFFAGLALELNSKFVAGVAVQDRLGYDDVNESFCNGARVHVLLRYLHNLGR